MTFRLKALALHLLASTALLLVLFGILYLGWYRWPGWYLADVSGVAMVMAGVDLIVGPVLTSIVAGSSKPRRVLARDIAVIVAVQLFALGYGTVSIWNGRPMYYAFSENVLQVVQAYDINSVEWTLASRDKPQFAPHWYSVPRWVWAPLPQDPQERQRIFNSAIGGGDDVISMPRYFNAWELGLPALKSQLKKVDDVGYFMPKDKKLLAQRMRAAGFDPDRLNAIRLTGRGLLLLAVFDPAAVTLVALFKAK